MQLTAQLSRTIWRPIEPPRGHVDRTAFHVSMLIPGIAHAFHVHVLDRSYTSVRKYKAQAEDAVRRDPDLQRALQKMIESLGPDDGLLMAGLRGPCQLPIWSRLAIAQFRKDGFTIAEIARAFRCSRRTVVNAARTNFLVPERRLAPQQLHPPAKIASKLKISAL